MRQLNYYIALLLLTATACEEKTDWKLDTADNLIIVDCIITNETKYQELTIYYSSPGMNQEPVAISDALIKLSYEGKTIDFISDTAMPGRYISTVPFMASAGNKYRLIISCNGVNDTARAEMTAINPLEPLAIVPGDSLYKYSYSKSNRASMMEVYYDWSDDTAYSEYYGAPAAKEVFYSLDNIDASSSFAPTKQIIEFPKNTRIIRRKYSLSDEHQEFIRSLLLETEWRGGLFDVEQADVPTNFRHGVRGWFAACMVLTDTTVFEIGE